MGQFFWDELYAYDPYGKVTVMNASWTTLSGSAYGWQHLHQGGRLDATSGLYYFRNRDFSPTLGRWASVDQTGFASNDTNLFRYLGSNPIQRVDPSGYAWWEYIPIVGTVGHLVFGPPGVDVNDYSTATPSAAECRKDRESAIKKCSDDITRLAIKHLSDWTGTSFGADAMKTLAGVVTDAIGFIMLKHGLTRSAVGVIISGGILVVDGIADAAITIRGIVRIGNTATEATRQFCVCDMRRACLDNGNNTHS